MIRDRSRSAGCCRCILSVAHDPTERNRQGPDVGPQYRSTIFPLDDEQARIAKAYIEQLNAARAFSKPIVTTIESGKTFYPAEDYHQDYLTRHPREPYIVINDLPKIDDLKRLFPELYRVIRCSSHPTLGFTRGGSRRANACLRRWRWFRPAARARHPGGRDGSARRTADEAEEPVRR